MKNLSGLRVISDPCDIGDERNEGGCGGFMSPSGLVAYPWSGCGELQRRGQRPMEMNDRPVFPRRIVAIMAQITGLLILLIGVPLYYAGKSLMNWAEHIGREDFTKE